MTRKKKEKKNNKLKSKEEERKKHKDYLKREGITHMIIFTLIECIPIKYIIVKERMA
jgi:hypothetical protein